MKKLQKLFLALLASMLLTHSYTDIKAIPPIKNLFNILRTDDIGLGQTLYHSKTIEKIYASKEDSATKQLTKALFHRDTENDPIKSSFQKAANYITPDIFGQLMGHIYTGNINNDTFMFNKTGNNFKGWIKDWLEKRKTEIYIPSKKKEKKTFRGTHAINIIENIRKSLQEVKHGKYPPRTTEGILWAFFYLKYKGNMPAIKTCLQALDKTIKKFNKTSPNKIEIFNNEYSKKIYDDTFYITWEKDAYKDFEKKIKNLSAQKQLELIKKNYDEALHSFLIRNQTGLLPPKVIFRNIGELAGLCVEIALLDLISILLYNPETENYDDSLLNPEIRKSKGFIELRKILKYPSEVNSDAVISKWASLLKKELNLEEGLRAYLKQTIDAINYFLGTKIKINKDDIEYEEAKNIEAFSKILSYGDREITFAVQGGINHEIIVTVKNKKKNTQFEAILYIETDEMHASLGVPIRAKITMEAYSKDLLKLINQHINDKKDYTLLPFHQLLSQ